MDNPAIASTIDGYYDRDEASIGQVLQTHVRLDGLARQINAAGRGHEGQALGEEDERPGASS